jgi:hypothetical protein
MITAEQVAGMAGSLGTVAGLARVSAEIESLSRKLIDGVEVLSRDELAQMNGALHSLNSAILSMDCAVRGLLGHADARVVDCVG